MEEDRIVIRRKLKVALIVDYDFDTFMLVLRDVSSGERVVRQQEVRPGRVDNGKLVHVEDRFNIGAPFDAMVVDAKWWRCDDGPVRGKIALYKGVSMRRATAVFNAAAKDREHLAERKGDDLYECVYDLLIQRTYGETDKTGKTVAVASDIEVIDNDFFRKQTAGN